VNLIFEGSSEIMRLIIAREALDPHLKAAGAAIDSRAPIGTRLKAAIKAGWFYARWFPPLLLPFDRGGGSRLDRRLRRHLRRVSARSRKLARTIFLQMARYGAKFEAEQVQLGRLVDIGTELFVMAVTCSHAQHVANTEPARAAEVIELADVFCRDSTLKIDQLFLGVHRHSDRRMRKVADRVLDGEVKWLEEGIV
jgi:hypothetical protein